jgi:hypothetical protein
MLRRSIFQARNAACYRTSWTRCSHRITPARRLRGQELLESRPSIRLAVTAALSRKECERAAGVIKAAVAKVLKKRK